MYPEASDFQFEFNPDKTRWRTCVFIEKKALRENLAGPGRYILLIDKNIWWEIPGGEYNFRDFYYGKIYSLHDEAKREVNEETGLEIGKIINFMGVTVKPPGSRPINNQVLIYRYTNGHLPELNIHELVNPEHSDYLWLKVGPDRWYRDNVPDLRFDESGNLTVYTLPGLAHVAFLPNTVGNKEMETGVIKLSDVTQRALEKYQRKVTDFVEGITVNLSYHQPEVNFG